MSHHYSEIVISDPWFDYIRSGKKSIEGRKNKHPWNKLEIGKIVKIISREDPTEFFYASVSALRPYSNGLLRGLDPLDHFLLNENLERTLPGISSFEEARKIYLGFSTIEEIISNGMLAIELSVE